MGTVRKRTTQKGTAWFLDYINTSGKRVRQIIPEAKTKHEAERVLRKRLAGVLEGREELPTSTRVTFGEYAGRWLLRRRLRLKISTASLYGAYLEDHLLPGLGDKRLREIDSAVVEGFIAGLREKKCGPKTCNNVLQVVKTILRDAAEEGLAKIPTVKPLRVPKREIRVLSPEELSALLATADPEARPLLLAAATTGCRQGELLAWTWDDVDFRSSSVTIVRRVHKGVVDEPKSSASKRTVALPKVLVDALRLLRKQQAENRLRLGDLYQDQGLVFCREDGRPIHYAQCDRMVKKAAKRAGLRALRFHDLRHCHASLLLALGESIRTVADRLGHASPTTTLRLYAHLLPGADRQAAAKIDEALRHAQGTENREAAQRPRHSWGYVVGEAGVEPATSSV